MLGSIEQAGHTMLHIRVEDDGPGIPPEHKLHLLEPFFTTKRDASTGLGLRLTKEIVQRYGGWVEVVARADGEPGAAFSILLPMSSNLSDVAASRGRVPTFQPEPDGRIDNEDLIQKGE